MIQRSTKILHIGLFDKFPQQQLDFLAENGMINGHFMVANKIIGTPLSNAVREHSKVGGRLAMLWEIFLKGYAADKIIIHSLLCRKTLIIMAIFPWLLRKSCWIIWGGDLYLYHERNRSIRNRFYELVRKKIIHTVPEIFSATPGDGDLCFRWYKTSGKYINAFTYPNSIVRTKENPTDHTSRNDAFKILLGNNSYPSNRHLEALTMLKERDNGEFVIICPLAYGDSKYREQVCIFGKKLFGDRFQAKTEMLHLDDYVDFLDTVDVAIFNNDRQQGMGNIRQLLAFGKKVYMRPGTTSWEHLNSLGIKIFPVNDFDLSIHFEEKNTNREKIATYYSKEAYVNGLQKLFAPYSRETRQ